MWADGRELPPRAGSGRPQRPADLWHTRACQTPLSSLDRGLPAPPGPQPAPPRPPGPGTPQLRKQPQCREAVQTPGPGHGLQPSLHVPRGAEGARAGPGSPHMSGPRRVVGRCVGRVCNASLARVTRPSSHTRVPSGPCGPARVAISPLPAGDLPPAAPLPAGRLPAAKPTPPAPNPAKLSPGSRLGPLPAPNPRLRTLPPPPGAVALTPCGRASPQPVSSPPGAPSPLPGRS